MTTTLSDKYFLAACERYLSPFLDLLEIQKAEMKLETWLDAVRRLQESVQRSPEQYFGNEMPNKNITETVVTQFFNEFVARHSERKFSLV